MDMPNTLNLDWILYHACGNPPKDADYDEWQKAEDAHEHPWTEYRIETHCVAFIVVARYNGTGYDIREFTMEDC